MNLVRASCIPTTSTCEYSVIDLKVNQKARNQKMSSPTTTHISTIPASNKDGDSHKSRRFQIIPITGKTHIARGAFGTIEIAVCWDTQTSSVMHHCAMKVVQGAIQDQSLTLPLFNEIAALKSVSHKHIIPLWSVHAWKDEVTLVFPYAPIDLSSILYTQRFRHFQPLSDKCTRLIMCDILQGLEHLHQHNIIHCDIKPANIFLSSQGYFQLGDFGLAQRVEESLPATGLCTLPYRPPELLLGSQVYHPSMDMWGVGLIFAELLTSRPLFHGTTVLDQLSKIIHLLGTPTIESWPSMTELPNYDKVIFEQRNGIGISSLIHKIIHDEALESILNQLVVMNPEKRCNAKQALNHEWMVVVESKGRSILEREKVIETFVPMEYQSEDMKFSSSKQEEILQIMKKKGLDIAEAKRNEANIF